MAWIVIPEPGSEYGPCKEPCQHRDCAASRADASKICVGCKKPIGYNNRYSEYNGPWHTLCLEDSNQ